jgi:hypothetical protein
MTTTRASVLTMIALATTGCAGRYVSPLAPPPYRSEISGSYDRTWRAMLATLAAQNVPLRAVARDSGVIASDDFVTPIGLYADCGRLGDDPIEGEAVVSYTLFATPNGTAATAVQLNSKMHTQAYRKGTSGKLKPLPVYQCASTGRFELNFLDAVRDLVKE